MPEELTGYFVIGDEIHLIVGEEEARAAARDPEWPSGVIYWTRDGAEAELARLRGEETTA